MRSAVSRTRADQARSRPIGGRRDGKTRDQLAIDVADAGADAGNAFLRFLAVGRVTLRAHLGELVGERLRIGQGLLGGAAKAGALRVGRGGLRAVFGEEHFAHGRDVQRRARA